MVKNLRLVYITTENKEEAKKIGSSLVEDHLAACVNIIDGMESMFWWDGEVKSGQETILIAKTTLRNMGDLTRRVKKLHSYDCPCIVTFSINEQEGNQEYLDWLEEEVSTDDSAPQVRAYEDQY
jgi:periplasmic divalent cation tolerance protein